MNLIKTHKAKLRIGCYTDECVVLLYTFFIKTLRGYYLWYFAKICAILSGQVLEYNVICYSGIELPWFIAILNTPVTRVWNTSRDHYRNNGDTNFVHCAKYPVCRFQSSAACSNTGHDSFMAAPSPGKTSPVRTDQGYFYSIGVSS